MNFAKFPRTHLLKKTSGRLLLEMTQKNLQHFVEALCKMYLFLTRCRHYKIFRDVLHFCEKFHKKSLLRNLLVIWRDFSYFLNNALADLKKMKCFLFYSYGIFNYFIHSSFKGKYKNENVILLILYEPFLFFKLQLLQKQICPILLCIKVVLGLDLVHSKYTGNIEKILR